MTRNRRLGDGARGCQRASIVGGLWLSLVAALAACSGEGNGVSTDMRPQLPLPEASLAPPRDGTAKLSPAENGGMNAAYAYGSFPLTNSGSDALRLYAADGTLVDEVAYDASWKIPDGASLSLKAPGLDNSLYANYCVEPSPWPGSLGDRGTPLGKAGCK